jgi:hypothetical protein
VLKLHSAIQSKTYNFLVLEDAARDVFLVAVLVECFDFVKSAVPPRVCRCDASGRSGFRAAAGIPIQFRMLMAALPNEFDS